MQPDGLPNLLFEREQGLDRIRVGVEDIETLFYVALGGDLEEGERFNAAAV
jgi:hypothetical protein